MIGVPLQRTIAFGTDGVRGHAEQFPFTDDALYAFGKALAQWAQEKYQKPNPKFLIGADTRISSPRIKKAVLSGLAKDGVQALDAGVLPTPAICQRIFYDVSFDAGIVISASHNPYYDNGIKIFDARRCKITPQDEQTIIRYFEKFLAEVSDTVSDQKINVHQAPDVSFEYVRTLQSLFQPHFLNGKTIVLDCANGATHVVASTIFKALGADVKLIAASPNGLNINDQCGSLYPESLIKAVKDQNADCGFAFDGDGDRIIAVNRHGDVKDGDDILALLHTLPAYKHLSKLVGTVMTNQGFEAELRQQGKELLRTAVGDKYVAAKLEEENLPLGGELSGHIIMRDYLITGDGIFVALKVLEAMIANDNWDMKTFAKYPQVLINVPVAQKKDLSQPPFAKIIAESKEILANGRLVVRYSGTEHLLRVMTEAESYEKAQMVASDLAKKLQEALQVNL